MKTLVPTLLLLILVLGCSPSRDTLLAKAATQLKNGEVDEAYKTYKTLYDRNSIDVDVLQGLIKTAQQIKKEETIVWQRELLKYTPWDREANIAVGLDLSKQGNYKDAIHRLLLAYHNSIFKDEKREVLAHIQQVTQLMEETEEGKNVDRPE